MFIKKPKPEPAAKIAIPAAFLKTEVKTPAIKYTNTTEKKKYCGLGLIPFALLCCCLFLLPVLIIVLLAVFLSQREVLNYEVSNLFFAQTHVIPPEGSSWYGGATTLKLISKREALFMFEYTNRADYDNQTRDYLAENTYVHGFDPKGKFLGAIAANKPEDLPPTEANQTHNPFSTVHFSATIPGEWITPNFSLAVSTHDAPTGFCCTSNQTRFDQVDADSRLDIYTLPVYLYGANENNSVSMDVAGVIPEKHQKELWAKLPFYEIRVIPHPMGSLTYKSAVTAPRNSTAYVLTDRAQELDGYMSMGIVLRLLGSIRGVNAHVGTQFYAPMMSLQNNRSVGPGGGLGGGNTATGDAAYSGIFIHEMGHGFNLAHAAQNYPTGYPYANGSLSGSQWGYDSLRRVFLPNTLPYPSTNCASSRALTEKGECAKQDYMQGGAGDQARGDIYTMNSDFYAGRIQAWGNSVTSNDTQSPTGYSRWNAATKTRVPVYPITTGSGQGGLDGGLPYKRNVMVYTVLCTYSWVTTAVRRFYPVNKPYLGNLLRYIDPSNATSLAEIGSRGPAPWYCAGSGCDFTFRMTYEDGTVLNQLAQTGWRKFYSDEYMDNMTDPYSGNGYKLLAMNFPANKPAKKVELLETLKAVVNGMVGAKVLLTYDFNSLNV